MKRRVLLAIVVLMLAMIVLITLWSFDLWQRLVDKQAILSIREMLPFPIIVGILIGAVVISIIIKKAWRMLDVIPKRRSGAVAERDPSIKPSELFSIENEARKTLIEILGRFGLIIGLLFTGAGLALTQWESVRNRYQDMEGQITDRFTRAIAQLDSEKAIEVRLGGIYALERIAKDSEKDHWTIMEILTAYVREPASKYVRERTSNKMQDNVRKPSPSKTAKDTSQVELEKIPILPTDIQAILTVIRRRKVPWVGEEDSLDLTAAILPGADLNGAKLREAFLISTDLRRATFIRADLRGAALMDADLREADLVGANLAGADLSRANLAGANLFVANFAGTDLRWANLAGAALDWADLSEAKDLTWEQVSGAIVNDQTKLPTEMENQHKSELKVMREKRKKELEGK